MNVVAGFLIGAINETWAATAIVSVLWPFVYCLQVAILESSRVVETTAALAASGKAKSHPRLVFFGAEFATALFTALPVALITHAGRRLIL